MEITRHHRNVHEIKFTDTENVDIAMLSDLHWDNPHCDRKLLKQHLDYCVDNKIPIMVNGDFFCLMQGRGDPRRAKSDIRPEHNTNTYLDTIIEDAVEWWSPYAKHLTVIGYGNHETSIIRHQETDILERFVQALNITNGTKVHVGGYGGWLVFVSGKGTQRSATKVKYYHGSGGGGPVTKGAIPLTRAKEAHDNFDVFTMGHIHENSARNDCVETLDGTNKRRIIRKDLHLMITGTYKEEYGDGFGGFHVEKGRPPKPVGGRILSISTRRQQEDGERKMVKVVDSRRFAA